MILTLVVFIFILSLLVLIHEFGHFIVGKWAGIGVLEFALGLPFTKPLWTKKLRGGMNVSLYPVLFGGFVKLLGEERPTAASGVSEGQGTVSGRLFYRTSVGARIAVVVAGVIMNFLLAVVAFYIFLAMANWQVLIPKLASHSFLSPSHSSVVVVGIQDNSPAKAAGLKNGDVIIGINGQKYLSADEFRAYTKVHGGQPVNLEISNFSLSSDKIVTVVPRINPGPGQGALGVRISEGFIVKFASAGEKVVSGLSYSWDMLTYNLQVISGMVFSAVKTGNAAPLADSVSGPVGIASAVGTIIDLGGSQAVLGLVNLIGLLSLSLAFMNILPIPAMDGGRLAFLLIEALFGKKLAAKNEALINQAGMILLLGLIILISYNDIAKLFRH